MRTTRAVGVLLRDGAISPPNHFDDQACRFPRRQEATGRSVPLGVARLAVPRGEVLGRRGEGPLSWMRGTDDRQRV